MWISLSRAGFCISIALGAITAVFAAPIVDGNMALRGEIEARRDVIAREPIAMPDSDEAGPPLCFPPDPLCS
ncbi:hypothetical protein CERSUDRAFT_98767 [Gelatoporia subvermispora B]|uniref:Uncharacterized protein n=1 Tax=Ceriporiopsis subvermispora (strain B) TaxID=914234 RepID=M2QLY0_CERS8|nr:hypothetical protein CERSUDRAFT_98767 [Gelatoporia subvermispora B]